MTLASIDCCCLYTNPTNIQKVCSYNRIVICEMDRSHQRCLQFKIRGVRVAESSEIYGEKDEWKLKGSKCLLFSSVAKYGRQRDWFCQVDKKTKKKDLAESVDMYRLMRAFESIPSTSLARNYRKNVVNRSDNVCLICISRNTRSYPFLSPSKFPLTKWMVF